MRKYVRPLNALRSIHGNLRASTLPRNASLVKRRQTYATVTPARSGIAAEDHAENPPLPFARREGAQIKRVSRPRTQTRAKRHADLEAPWLSDPLELTNRVRQLVRDDFDKALELTKSASSKMQCTISYNWLIDDCLKRGAVTQAFGLYNDMKKRRQFPDSYTITILLRGLREQQTLSPANLARALDVYRSLSAANSHVTRTIIHTNAILALCAAHKDMSAMWTIVGGLPETGPDTVDIITYATLLKAIRQEHSDKINFDHHRAAECTEDELHLRRQAVADGKRLWVDVVSKWSQGKLRIDETLVVQMGLLLQIGFRDQDLDNVLSLVQQTMGIPRFVDAPLPHQTDVVDSLPPTHDDDDADADVFRKIPSLEAPAPTTRPRKYKAAANKASLIDPGAPTLSLVLNACLGLQAWKAAHEYWRYVTEEKHVVPDRDNYNSYLRILRATRSSARAVGLLRQINDRPKDSQDIRLGSSTYMIAMSICSRDSKNINMLEHAAAIIDLMLHNRTNSTPPTDHRPHQHAGARLRLDPKSIVILERYLDLCIEHGEAHHTRNAFEQLLPLLDTIYDYAWTSVGYDQKNKFVSDLLPRASRASGADGSVYWEQVIKRLRDKLKGRDVTKRTCIGTGRTDRYAGSPRMLSRREGA